LKQYARDGENRVIPFISPLAPFVDPGSRAFEEPEKHGYKLFARTLEEHRRQLLAPILEICAQLRDEMDEPRSNRVSHVRGRPANEPDQG
jgi:hypothetical protein